jgi:ATP-dependent DNA ligase
MRRAAARRRKRLKPGDLPGAVRAPYPEFINPCLATPGTAVAERGHWLHEIKHDGSGARSSQWRPTPHLYPQWL